MTVTEEGDPVKHAVRSISSVSNGCGVRFMKSKTCDDDDEEIKHGQTLCKEILSENTEAIL